MSRGGPPKEQLQSESGPGEDYDVIAAGRELLELLIKVAAFTMLTVLIVSALSLFYVASMEWLHIAVVLSSGLLTAALGWVALRTRVELLPSIAPAWETIEFDGVQMQVLVPEVCPRGRRFAVTVLFQNCVNRARNVRLEFESELKASEVREQCPLFFHRLVTGSLGPGETAEVKFPLVLGPSAPTNVSLWVSPSATGVAARRVRFAKGRTFEERVTTGETLAVLAIGGIYFGGGLAIRPRSSDAPPEEEWKDELPAPTWRVLHAPPLELLRKASA